MKTIFSSIKMALITIVISGCGLVNSCGEAPQATEQANEWAAKMDYEKFTATCADGDSDGDGKISCSVRVIGDKEKGIADELIPLDCTARFTWSDGCNLQKARVNMQGK